MGSLEAVKGELIDEDEWCRFYQHKEIEDYWFVERKGEDVPAIRQSFSVLKFLNTIGVRTSFVECVSDSEIGFVAKKCKIFESVWSPYRIATPEFVERHPKIELASRFAPLLIERHTLDDPDNRRLWSREEMAMKKFADLDMSIRAVVVTNMVADVDSLATVVFEILERVCLMGVHELLTHVEVRIGVIRISEGVKIVLWELCLPVTVKEELLETLISQHSPPKSMSTPSIAILIDENRDGEEISKEIAKEIVKELEDSCGIFTVATITTSVHESTQNLLEVVARLNQWPSCKCIIAICNESNALGQVVNGNSDIPVINCFPPTTPREQLGANLILPSGLGCTTVLGAKSCARAAARIIANDDIYVWCKMKFIRANNALGVIELHAYLSYFERRDRVSSGLIFY